MYNKLIINRNQNNGTLNQIEDKLNKLGHIEWVNLPEGLETQFRNIDDAEQFIRMLMYLNYSHTGRRYSNRYQKFVNFGNAGNRFGTNRSVIDMFLIAKHYNPKFANFKILYEALLSWYSNDNNLQCQICSTIHKRVWFCNNQRYDLNRILTSKSDASVKLMTSYINSEMAKPDETGTKIIIKQGKVEIIYNEDKPESFGLPNGTLSVSSGTQPSSTIFIKA